MDFRIGAFVFALTLAAPAAAQETRHAAPGAPPTAATLAAANWLEGTWTGEGIAGAPATEVYGASLGGGIAGHFVQAKPDGGVRFYELMQIVPRGGSLVYRLRHFNADLTGWEDTTSRAEEFPLIAVERDALFFDGMTFRRTGPETMTVWVSIGERSGGAHEIAFRYRRTKR